MPGDEPGELVDGRLEEEEASDLQHELVVSWLVHVLRSWPGGRGFVFGSEPCTKSILSPVVGIAPTAAWLFVRTHLRWQHHSARGVSRSILRDLIGQ